MLRKVIIILISGCCFSSAFAQTPYRYSLDGRIQDASSGRTLEWSAVQLTSLLDSTIRSSFADSRGNFAFDRLPGGRYRLQVNFTGYRPLTREIQLTGDTTVRISLMPLPVTSREVVVSATESRGNTSASRIDRQAMEHIQPSSLADLMELLPGGKTIGVTTGTPSDPSRNTPNYFRMREAGMSGDNYDISYLGTAYLVDGVPLSVNANLQSIPGSSADDNYVLKGIDMRSIGTDNIESIEVVRGIPSVEHGDLTKGLIQINRIARATPFTSRFKADQYGKLFSAGKGIDAGKGRVLNLDMDYLDAKDDPRNTLESYKRITASARLSGERTGDISRLRWQVSADYTASIDNIKSDADVDAQADRFRTSYHKMRASSNLGWKFFDAGILRSLDITASLSQQLDRMEQIKNVYLNRVVPLPVATETGAHDAELLPFIYLSEMTTDGKPLNAFLKSTLGLGFHTGKVEHRVKAGGDWRYDKNFGRGQVYDLTRPVNPNNTNRPRAFRDIPAMSQLGFFIEDAINIRAGEHRIVLTPGLRGTSQLNLAKEYKMHGKVYLDPRVNVEWKLPVIGSGPERWEFEITGGIGWHTKTPTMSQLYPDLYYADIVQLNYYPADADLRRINLMTYVVDNTNFDLNPARNRKWEVRGGMFHKGMRFSVTYFEESTTSGFRNMSYYKILPYKSYDVNAIEAGTYPDLNTLPYTNDTLLTTFGRVSNGSRIDTKGVEFQFSTPRFDGIKTRITVTGAWFRTIYSNSAPIYKSTTANVGGALHRYVGRYDWQDGSIRERFNTSFMFDTYIERLGLTFSTTFQCLWYTSYKPLRNDGTPVTYVDASGIERPFTEADKEDPYLKALVTTYTDGYFAKTVIPFGMDVNFKATKHFGKYARLAMYVNRLFSAYPSYYRGNNIVRRSVLPYFGMELNLTF